MCFELDSAPPIPPISGAAVSHDDLVLEAADGNRLAAFEATPEEPARVGVVILPDVRGLLAAFEATPEEPARVGVVILPDVRGLYRFYEELALRFAERGYTAVAFDYFGRTAGAEKRGDDFEYMAHVRQTTSPGVQADVAACVARLRANGCESIFTVGFCYGGRNSWVAAASGHGLSGAIGFYGGSKEGHDGSPGPTQLAADMTCPVLALQAGDDQNISAEDNTAFDAALTAAGVEHEVVTYPGAPHSFFDRKYEEFAADSEDAWHRVLAFLERYS